MLKETAKQRLPQLLVPVLSLTFSFPFPFSCLLIFVYNTMFDIQIENLKGNTRLRGASACYCNRRSEGIVSFIHWARKAHEIKVRQETERANKIDSEQPVGRCNAEGTAEGPRGRPKRQAAPGQRALSLSFFLAGFAASSLFGVL